MNNSKKLTQEEKKIMNKIIKKKNKQKDESEKITKQ